MSVTASGGASLAASGCTSPAARAAGTASAFCAAVNWSADLDLTARGKTALSFSGAGIALRNSGAAPPKLTALGAVMAADIASLGPSPRVCTRQRLGAGERGRTAAQTVGGWCGATAA